MRLFGFGKIAHDNTPALPPLTAADVPMAVAMLLLEVAMIKDALEAADEEKIIHLLMQKFDCSRCAALQTIQQADMRREEDPAAFYTPLKVIKDSCNSDARCKVLDMAWQVVYADGHIDETEKKMLRRIAGLLLISDTECESIQQKVAEEFQRRQLMGLL